MEEWITCRPSFDPASTYSHTFCQELIDLMEEWNTTFFDHSGDEATRVNVEAMLFGKPQAHFLFMDHGSEEGLVAQGGQDYIIDSRNVALLKDRITYTLACSWGKDGGWQAYREGALAVHCYAAVVGFMTTSLKEFQESFNYGFKLLHEIGPNFTEILSQEKTKLTELSDKLMQKGDFLGAMWMNTNRDSLKWYGGGSEPPESKCFWRRLAIKIFGSKKGWNLTKS